MPPRKSASTVPASTTTARSRPRARRFTTSQERELWELMSTGEREAWLRLRATPSEKIMCQLLDLNPKTAGRYKFQAHCGGYYADFLFLRPKLIVELDGAVHHGIKAKLADAARTRSLERAGYRVMRFWNGQLREPVIVLNRILEALGEKPLASLVSPTAKPPSLDDIMITTRTGKRAGTSMTARLSMAPRATPRLQSTQQPR